MAFKLGDESRKWNMPKEGGMFKMNTHRNDPNIKRERLDENTFAEANMDGSISVDDSVDLDSAFGKRVVKHESEHIDQIQSGRASYGEGHVMWEGKIYFRNNGMIDGPNGRLPEGHPNHPWEQEAIQAENE